MSESLLHHLRTAIVTPEQITAAGLRRLHCECSVTFKPQRCPHCHARLFDGWLFGKIKCWRCAETFTGYLDKFVEALAQTGSASV